MPETAPMRGEALQQTVGDTSACGEEGISLPDEENRERHWGEEIEKQNVNKGTGLFNGAKGQWQEGAACRKR